MNKKLQKISLAAVIIMFAIMCVALFTFRGETQVVSAEENPSRVIESGLEFSNTLCNLDNGFIPYNEEFKRDSHGNTINSGGDINLEVHEFTSGNTFYTTKCYVRHKKYLCRNIRTNAISAGTNYYNKVIVDSGYVCKIKIQTNRDIVDDSWEGGVYGVPNSTGKIGKGALFYRINTYDENGNYVTGNWMNIFNLFGNSTNYYLPFQINGECDLEMVNVYEKYVDNQYYNMRQEFMIKFRTPNEGQFIIEKDTGSVLTQNYVTTSASTNKGFMIEPSGFMTVKVSHNGGAVQNYNLAQLKAKQFVENGVYDIEFLSDIETYGRDHRIIVDKTLPGVNVGTEFIGETYEHNYNGKYFIKSDTALNVSWSVGENFVPLTVKKKIGDILIDVQQNDVLELGEHTLVVTKNYSLESVTAEIKIEIKAFAADNNYNLLTSGSEYANLPNKFSTRYYGVRLIENGKTVNYGYSTKQAALEKGMSYEYENEVTENADGTYLYRGVTFPDNASMTAVINQYVQANYYFENRDLTDTNTTMLDASLKQQTVYLNGFRFTYGSNPAYSNSVRMIKSTESFPTLDATVKSILRDVENANVINIQYETDLNNQLSETGRYFIRETNCFGAEYFYEAIYVAENCTTATIVYSNTSGIPTSTILDCNSVITLQGSNFNISAIENVWDEFATIKITNFTNTINKILVAGDTFQITEEGTYQLRFIDRNGFEFTKTLMVSLPDVELKGVENGGTADNNVTISLKNGYTLTAFYVNGAALPSTSFVLNADTQRYEYTIMQTDIAQEVVLLVNYGNDISYQIGFTVSPQA